MRRLSTSALLFALALPVTVSAQIDPDGLVRAGIAMRQAGDHEGARDVFRRAVEAGGGPRARAQLALAEQALGLFVEAEAHLAEAMATDHAWIEDHREVLDEAMARIRESLGSIELRVDVEGARVLVDDREVGVTPLAEPIRHVAGTAVVVIEAQGYEPTRIIVNVRAGQPSVMSPTLVAIAETRSEENAAEPPPDPASSSSDATPTSASQTAVEESSLWLDPTIAAGIATGLVAAGAVVAAILRELWALQYSDRSRCPAPRQVECADIRRDAVAAEAAVAGLGIAASALAVATICFGIALGLEEDSPQPTAAIGPNGGWLGLRWRSP